MFSGFSTLCCWHSFKTFKSGLADQKGEAECGQLVLRVMARLLSSIKHVKKHVFIGA